MKILTTMILNIIWGLVVFFVCLFILIEHKMSDTYRKNVKRDHVHQKNTKNDWNLVVCMSVTQINFKINS